MPAAHKAKILLTGAGGYVGLPTARALLSRGCDVHIIGRTDPRIPGTTFHRADLLEVTENNAIVADIGAETLLHLAWSVTPKQFWTDPANRDWAVASQRLFHAFAKSGGQRIAGVGSCAEYDWSASPLSELSSPIRPATPYGEAKVEASKSLAALGEKHGLSVAWARLFFLYGPGEPRGKLVADAVNALLARREFATTSGLQIRDFIFVDDAAEALAQLTLSSTTGPVNIARGEGVTVRELIEKIEAATRSSGLANFGARPLSNGEPYELVADISRLRDEIGFVPRFSLVDGVERTVDWWREKSIIGASA